MGAFAYEHTWLLSDVDAHPLGPRDDSICEKFSYAWAQEIVLTGKELCAATEALLIQYVWAVFSPLRPGHSIDLANPQSLPFADCNPALWEADPQPQHEDALFELVAWDSSYTLVICRDDEWHAKILEWFPSATTIDPRPWPTS